MVYGLGGSVAAVAGSITRHVHTSFVPSTHGLIWCVCVPMPTIVLSTVCICYKNGRFDMPCMTVAGSVFPSNMTETGSHPCT